MALTDLSKARKITKDYLKLYYEGFVDRGITFDIDGVWIGGFRYEIRENKVYLLDIDKFLLDEFYKNSLIEIPDVFEEVDFINENLYDIIGNWDKPFSLEADGLKNFNTKIFSGSKIENISLKLCKSIGDEVLNRCLNLKNVVIPQIKYIGNNSFEGDYTLFSIDIRTVKRIGVSSFEGCNNCNFVGEDYPDLLEIGERAFCRSGIERMVANRLQEIPKYAFNSSSLTHFKGDKVKKLETCAFYGSELVVFDCPNLNILDYDCFGMTPLKEIECYARYIQGYPFSDCSSLTHVTFPNLKKLECPLFRDCNNLKYLNLPNCVEIKGGLVRDSNINDVYLPSLRCFTGTSLSWDAKKTKVHLNKNCEIDSFYWNIFNGRVIIDL